MSPTRREFLAGSSAFMGAAALGLNTEALADALREQGHAPTLVTIYLRGGADPLQTIIPAGDPEYYRVRPTIAVPAKSKNPGRAVMPVSRLFGFHPALEPLMPLYKNKKMAGIVSVGSTHPTRSHFDAQDFMERAAPGVKSVTEGWLNRYLTATSSEGDRPLRALSMQPTLPRSLRGRYPVLAVPTGATDRAMSAFELMYSCDDHAEAMLKNKGEGQARADKQEGQDKTPEVGVNLGIAQAGEESIEKLRHLNKITRGRGTGRYPDSGLAKRLSHIAKVIKAGEGLEVAAVDYGGWDHHAYQGGNEGTMAEMLGTLAEAIRAFHDDLGSHMDKTLVLVMSEFGRTVRENGTYGTDHGRGGFMLAVGGMVKGGRLYGRYTGLEKKNLYQNRDLPVHVDFRVVFAEALYSLYGFRTDKTDFFPQYKANDRPVGFLSPIATG